MSAFVIEFISQECVAEFGSSILLCCIFIPPPSGVSKLCHLKVVHMLSVFDLLNSEFLVRYGIESCQNNFNVYSHWANETPTCSYEGWHCILLIIFLKSGL